MKGRININRPTPGIQRVVLPRVGFIKVGYKEKATNGKEYPKSVDYFIASGKYAGLFTKAYGDGETFFVWNGKQYAQYSTKDYPNLMAGVTEKHPNRAVLNGGDGWIVTLTVTFIIPLVRGVAGGWQFVTKGTASTIPNIRDTFDAMLQERGFVKGIVWDMNVQFAVSQKPGDRSRYPVVSIVPNESEGNLRKVTEVFNQ